MTIKKWLPRSMWDFIGLQNWINEQAAAGYALMAWPGAWDIGRISFQEGSSARTARYRLEPMDDRMGEQERNELYAQSGWTYITKIHKLCAVYRCDDPEAPELYADPDGISVDEIATASQAAGIGNPSGGRETALSGVLG